MNHLGEEDFFLAACMGEEIFQLNMFCSFSRYQGESNKLCRVSIITIQLPQDNHPLHESAKVSALENDTLLQKIPAINLG